ncbi:MAG: pentapeptide repeat-containing protein [Planctomycetaceae bacterium]|nr:pentapeptide repeat-containing protein [Planctomycetaceae bacterium]
MIEPALAAVRPRVTSPVTGDTVLLQDEVQELIERGQQQPIVVIGERQSGKTVALQHLAAVLPDADSIHLIDNAHSDDPPGFDDERPIICTLQTTSGWRGATELRLCHWSRDEWIEYLLALHPDKCGDVISRVGDGHFLNGSPLWWSIALDALASDEIVPNVHAAVRKHLNAVLTSDELRRHVERYCLLACDESDEPHIAEMTHKAFMKMRMAGLSRQYEVLFTHASIHTLLGADGLLRMLQSTGETHDFGGRMPHDLVKATGGLIAGHASLLLELKRAFSKPDGFFSSSVRKRGDIASLVRIADPDWRPKSLPRGINLWGAYLDHVDWSGICLKKDDLTLVDFSGAILERADLRSSTLHAADFSSANLESAQLEQSRGHNVDFAHADLRDADLTKTTFGQTDFSHAIMDEAKLSHACCNEADFTGASLRGAELRKAVFNRCNFDSTDFLNANLKGAQLDRADLRTAILNKAVFTGACLSAANLEDVEWPDAELSGAYLSCADMTGSRLHRADFRKADLRNAKLGEIDWEGADLRDADLRGATFHMGSSREGLLFSPFASEGSRTGFYTDEISEQHYKAPEEIRKASLRGCDLRGANIEGLDFYLVDLRDALMTPDQLAYVEQSGAILTTEY